VRIAFLGTPSAAVPALRALVDAGHDVPLVVTRPDRPAGRSGRPLPPPVKLAALELGLPLAQPDRLPGGQLASLLAEVGPDALVVVAYGRILRRAVLDVPRLAPINLHFSLLPAYRGAAPVQWALARGETTTGVTTMVINEQLDEGDLLLQRPLRIEPGEHAPSLERRLAEMGAPLLIESLEGLASSRLTPRPQDHSAASHAPSLAREDGHVDPASLSAREIEGRVRGFDPWPGVWLAAPAGRVRLVEATALPEGRSPAAPGSVLEPLPEAALPLVCRDGSLLGVERVQLAGRRPASARDALNGRQLAPGQRLEPLAHAPR
jgi:methionyl-tRNA formyltransferase